MYNTILVPKEMSRTVIIHVGHGKTGTSYIQSSLALNRGKLSELGISYPYDLSIERAIQGDTTSGNGALFQSNYLPAIEEVDQILFSSEILFHSLIDDGGLSLRNCLMDKYENVKIILFTRDILDMLVSTWGQLVKKMGATIGLNEYIQSRKDRHHEKVISWINLSKKMGYTLELRNYSKCKNNLLENFYSCLGLSELQTTSFTLPRYKIINRSLSNIELESLRIINKSIPDAGQCISDKLITESRDFSGSNPKITTKSLDIIKLHYKQMINQINEHLTNTTLLSIGDTDKYVVKDNSSLALTPKQVDIFAHEIKKSLETKGQIGSTQGSNNLQKLNAELSSSLADISKILSSNLDDLGADSLLKLKHTSPGQQKFIINSIRNIAYRIEEYSCLGVNDLEILDDIAIKLSSPQLFFGLGLWRKLEACAVDVASVAEKARSGVRLDLTDALLLMKVALALRPNGPIILQKVEEYERRL